MKICSAERKNEKFEREILDEKKFSLLKENEEFILSVTDKGFGKRSSSYEYRKTSRGGVGIAHAIATARKERRAPGSHACDQASSVEKGCLHAHCTAPQFRA